MAQKKKYTTASGMRIALEERLKNHSKETGIELIRLRRQVTFDRFLARIFSSGITGIIAKGGYTLELRLNRARTTKDIDFAFTGNLNGVWTGQPEDLQIFLNDIAQLDLNDFVLFSVGATTLNLDNAVYGGHRFPIEAMMAGRRFSSFSIDIAAGDAWIEPHETIPTHDWFDFAGIPPVKIPVISVEQQFAEKRQQRGKLSIWRRSIQQGSSITIIVLRCRLSRHQLRRRSSRFVMMSLKEVRLE